MKRFVERVAAGVFATCLSANLLAASPFTDAEAALREVYNDYRTALFQTNAGNGAAADTALTKAIAGWAALSTNWTASPPPQYQDDPALAVTLHFVSQTLAEAQTEAAEGALPEAHETLEAIRDALWQMHMRNGIIGFSDRMNAYHAKMEVVLGITPDSLTEAKLPEVLEQAAVLGYLAEDIANHPAPEATAQGYDMLVQAMQASTSALIQAARDGDVAATKAALSALKPAYAKLFAKFG